MPDFRTLDDVSLAGKRALVRCDLNVPMQDGKVTDATRIERSATTLKELAAKGAKVIILSHFGRPKGKRVAEMSLRPLVAPLAQALGCNIAFAEDCVGPAAEAAAAALQDGEVLLLENLRYHDAEEANDTAFAASLAKLGDLYVNDAFSCAHRAHASTEGIAHLMPAVAGRLMQAELDHLAAALEKPERPVMALVGGAKVSTKLDLLGNLVAKVDALVIGGGMANTFLFAQGIEIGKSLAERDLAATAREILGKAKAAGCEIVLPIDAVVAAEFKAGAASATVDVRNVPGDKMILDVGPKSVALVNQHLANAKTLVWNGPLGAFEVPPFDQGTNAVAQQAALLSKAKKLLSVAGGGDTVAALAHAGAEADFSYVSTAGGAFLEWLEGKELPGVKALAK
ncbi:phosphoglycerate kinase [Dongia mobilis]|uniref:Phosphoglycerate kinase n=1 Tax=Dongia mobilis TaxID=578943 RepID=A0A4R6WYB7_9PROT|nr:phosphoglycerate kinase [Dongia mobilis]TDQ85503.1 phosphoglycerate kinase [Dongia mobilis]